MPKLNFKGIVIPALSLFVICLVIAGALAGVNAVTAEPIAHNEARAADEARQAIFPDATFEDKGGYFNAYDAGGLLIGYCVETQAQGYGGPIKITVGLDVGGWVHKVMVINCDDETPGLGQKVKDEGFLAQFAGAQDTVKADSIASATYSSKGVENAINQALRIYQEQIKRGGAG